MGNSTLNVICAIFAIIHARLLRIERLVVGKEYGDKVDEAFNRLLNDAAKGVFD